MARSDYEPQTGVPASAHTPIPTAWPLLYLPDNSLKSRKLFRGFGKADERSEPLLVQVPADRGIFPKSADQFLDLGTKTTQRGDRRHPGAGDPLRVGDLLNRLSPIPQIADHPRLLRRRSPRDMSGVHRRRALRHAGQPTKFGGHRPPPEALIAILGSPVIWVVPDPNLAISGVYRRFRQAQTVLTGELPPPSVPGIIPGKTGRIRSLSLGRDAPAGGADQSARSIASTTICRPGRATPLTTYVSSGLPVPGSFACLSTRSYRVPFLT